MKSFKIIFLIIGSLVFLRPLALAEELVIVYSGHTHGALYPCNCPVRQDGGVSRRATLVEQLRKKHPQLLLLDCGNFTAGGRLDEYTMNTRLDMQRSRVNYQAMELMRYDAVGVGPDEFNFGREFFLNNIKKDHPVYLSANLDIPAVLPYIIKDVSGVRLAVLGLTGSSASQKAEGLKIGDASKISGLIEDLKTRQGVQVVVLLSTQGESRDLKLIDKTKGIDIILVGDQPQKEEPLTKVQDTYILRPPWQGRQLGKLTLEVRDGKLIDCKLAELPVTPDLARDPQIEKILPACFSDANCKDRELSGICRQPGELGANCVFDRPNKVNLTVIVRKDCRICHIEPVLQRLKNKFPGLSVNSLDLADKKAKNLAKDLDIRTLPAFIFDKKIEDESNFDGFKEELRAARNFYILKPQSSGISNFLGRPIQPGRLDLFFSLFDNQAHLLLQTLKAFDPALHFLVEEKNKTLSASQGVAEIEEDLRAVCVQKHYPEKFWDYLTCRAKNIHSSYWQDCLDVPVTDPVISCARGKEGQELLLKNTALNKELEVSVGPTYLVDNHEIFSSRGVPAKERLKEIITQK